MVLVAFKLQGLGFGGIVLWSARCLAVLGIRTETTGAHGESMALGILAPTVGGLGGCFRFPRASHSPWVAIVDQHKCYIN